MSNDRWILSGWELSIVITRVWDLKGVFKDGDGFLMIMQ
jgi:hypothetical protein